MDITFSCQKCGHAVSIDAACAGLLMKCTHCGASIVIPSTDSPAISIEESVTAERAFGEGSARRGVAVDTPARMTIQPHLDSTPADSEQAESPQTAPAARCPFCAESMRRQRAVCSVCGEPLPLLAGERPLLRARVLVVTLVSLITGVMLIVAFAGKSRSKALRHRLPAASREVVPVPPAEPVSPARARFVAGAQTLVEKIQAVHSAIEAGQPLKEYVRSTAELAAAVDALLAVAEDTGLYASNPDARKLCIAATAAFFNFDQALNQWNVETLCREQKVQLQRTLESAGAGGVTAIAPRLDELTARANAALQARAEQWQRAQEQLKTIRALIPKFEP